MSTVLSSKKYLFATDLGAVLVQSEEVTDYDVEDIVLDKSLSQAQIVLLENTASNIDVNAPKFPRQVSASGYLN